MRVFFFVCILVIGFCKPPELRNACDPNAFSLEDKLVSDLLLQSIPQLNTEVLQFLFPDKVILCASNPTNRGPFSLSGRGPFSLSGRIRGLTSQSITLTSGTNPPESLVINPGATTFAFPSKFTRGNSFNLTASEHSQGLCYVVNGQGTLVADVNNISVVCVEPLAYSGLSSWYRADSLNLGNGASVSSLNDLSPNNNHLAGSGAIFSSTGINGKPSINLLGNTLERSIASGLGGSSFSILIVFKRLGGSGTEEYVFFMGDNNGGCPAGSVALSIQDGTSGEIGVQTPCGAYMINPTPALAVPPSDSSPKLLQVKYLYAPTGNSIRYAMLNGAVALSGSATDIVYSNPNPYVQIGNYPAGTKPSQVSVAELLYFNRFLTEDESLQLDCYLAKKYEFAHATTCQ